MIHDGNYRGLMFHTCLLTYLPRCHSAWHQVTIGCGLLSEPTDVLSVPRMRLGIAALDDSRKSSGNPPPRTTSVHLIHGGFYYSGSLRGVSREERELGSDGLALIAAKRARHPLGTRTCRNRGASRAFSTTMPADMTWLDRMVHFSQR
jgi:hypothetical protein